MYNNFSLVSPSNTLSPWTHLDWRAASEESRPGLRLVRIPRSQGTHGIVLRGSISILAACDESYPETRDSLSIDNMWLGGNTHNHMMKFHCQTAPCLFKLIGGMSIFGRFRWQGFAKVFLMMILRHLLWGGCEYRWWSLHMYRDILYIKSYKDRIYTLYVFPYPI